MNSARIAILGATSQIARDLIVACRAQGWTGLHLFARRPEHVETWQEHRPAGQIRYPVNDFSAFSQYKFDAILNFVGVGNPAQAAAMGASIFDVTLQYDQFALDYVHRHPDCRYLFLSSGAAYGSDFMQPADENTRATVSLNSLKPQDWYGVAKLHAECRHRALAELPIADIRVFNYFSRTQDLEARFLITDAVRCITRQQQLEVSPAPMVRDYLHPQDFFALICALLQAPATNLAVDCYSQAPIDKLTLLDALRDNFGLDYRMATNVGTVNATGAKPNYFSVNRKAGELGYLPSRTSLEGILEEVRGALHAR